MKRKPQQPGLLIRAETPADHRQVFDLLTAAFDRAAEARLVESLRCELQRIVALVAVEDDRLVGQIVFSPVTVAGSDDSCFCGLAPLAVLPKRQRCGIGAALVRVGLEECRALQWNVVVVLGDPDYYARFGFRPAAQFGLQFGVPELEDAFQVLELVPGSLRHARGRVGYAPAFDDV